MVIVSVYSAFVKTRNYSQANYYKLKIDVIDKIQKEIGTILESRVPEYTIYDALIWGESNDSIFADERAADFVKNFVVMLLYKHRCVPVNSRISLSSRSSLSVSIPRNEIKLIFIERKGLFIIIIAAVLCATYISRPLDIDDMMYADYIRDVCGQITDDTFTYIDNKKAQYAQVNDGLSKLSKNVCRWKYRQRCFFNIICCSVSEANGRAFT